MKIAEEVRRTERQNCDKERGRNKKDSEPLNSFLRPKKKTRVDGLVRVGAPIAATKPQPCADYRRCHQGECWKRIRACLRCSSLEHRIRDCPRRPNQVQAMGRCTVQPPRGVQQPPRGRG